MIDKNVWYMHTHACYGIFKAAPGPGRTVVLENKGRTEETCRTYNTLLYYIKIYLYTRLSNLNKY